MCSDPKRFPFTTHVIKIQVSFTWTVGRKFQHLRRLRNHLARSNLNKQDQRRGKDGADNLSMRIFRKISYEIRLIGLVFVRRWFFLFLWFCALAIFQRNCVK